MAKTSYVDILEGMEEVYFKTLQSSDRFVVPRVRKKIPFLSRKRKKGVTQRSLLPQIAIMWNNFSAGQKTAWGDAGAESDLNGYRLFVQDQCLRIKNDLAGPATPSLLHQSLVGVLQIDEPAEELKIIQIHPRNYWVSRKVRGTKSQYEPVVVTEDLALPLKISLNYRAELESTGPGSFAKFYALVRSSYQGINFNNYAEIDLDLITDWKNDEDTLTEIPGYVVAYNLFFHIYKMRGTLYIDNVKAEHSAQNWVRDPFCKDINQGFTRAFYQIPKHWSAITAPSGSWFESFYIDW